MSGNNVNLKELEKRASEICLLINDVEKLADDDLMYPDMNRYRQDRVKKALKEKNTAKAFMALTSQAAYYMQPLTTRVVIDIVSAGIVRSSARRKLLAYYQELASKQSMIIEAQTVITRELSAEMNGMQKDTEAGKEKIRILTEKYAKTVALLDRIAAVKKTVEG